MTPGYEPFSDSDRKLVAIKLATSCIAIVTCTLYLVVMRMSGAMRIIENRINSIFVYLAVVMSAMFVITESWSLSLNRFALDFWLPAASVAPTMHVYLIVIHLYAMVVGSFPLWPEAVSDPYIVQPCRWVCYWNIVSRKPNMIVWMLMGLAGILLTPVQVLVMYNRIAAVLEKRVSSQAGDTVSVKEGPSRTELAMTAVIQRARLIAVMFVVSYWLVAIEMLYSFITRTRSHKLNVAVGICSGFMNTAYPLAFLLQDDTARTFLRVRLATLGRSLVSAATGKQYIDPTADPSSAANGLAVYAEAVERNRIAAGDAGAAGGAAQFRLAIPVHHKHSNKHSSPPKRNQPRTRPQDRRTVNDNTADATKTQFESPRPILMQMREMGSQPSPLLHVPADPSQTVRAVSIKTTQLDADEADQQHDRDTDDD
ncbi:hypothetical protein BC831DRAFT_449875 [Entophlyctis helioformis]|nr:hypothetical protein BC831DRAFT_449875 [Entophlyctis helioformis]